MIKRWEKGEIATIIAIGTLIFLGVSTLTSSLMLKNKQTSSTKARADDIYYKYPTSVPIKKPTVILTKITTSKCNAPEDVKKQIAGYSDPLYCCPAGAGRVGGANGSCPNYYHNSSDSSCSPCNIPTVKPAVPTVSYWGIDKGNTCNGYKFGECYLGKRCMNCGSYNCFKDDEKTCGVDIDYCPPEAPKTTCYDGSHRCCVEKKGCYSRNKADSNNITNYIPKEQCLYPPTPTSLPCNKVEDLCCQVPGGGKYYCNNPSLVCNASNRCVKPTLAPVNVTNPPHKPNPSASATWLPIIQPQTKQTQKPVFVGPSEGNEPGVFTTSVVTSVTPTVNPTIICSKPLEITQCIKDTMCCGDTLCFYTDKQVREKNYINKKECVGESKLTVGKTTCYLSSNITETCGNSPGVIIGTDKCYKNKLEGLFTFSPVCQDSNSGYKCEFFCKNVVTNEWVEESSLTCNKNEYCLVNQNKKYKILVYATLIGNLIDSPGKALVTLIYEGGVICSSDVFTINNNITGINSIYTQFEIDINKKYTGIGVTVSDKSGNIWRSQNSISIDLSKTGVDNIWLQQARDALNQDNYRSYFFLYEINQNTLQ